MYFRYPKNQLAKLRTVNKEVINLVSKLNLLPHPEGGYYKETYRSTGIIEKQALADNFNGNRNFCTGIYFLLTSDNFSAFHRIKQDEMWHFYSGSPLLVHVIYPDGNYIAHEVGMDVEKNQFPQLVVPAGCWFASSVKNSNDYSFVGCTVAPGFDFNDFELANRDDLIEQYPKHASIINKLTRQ